MTVKFDESLHALVSVIDAELGERATQSGVVLRDATGRLAFFTANEISEQQLEKIAKELQLQLGPYARRDCVIGTAKALGAEPLFSDPGRLFVRIENRFLQLIDRRLVGADWTRIPAGAASPPARYVFASLKGGVGRSTALCVSAAHLASKGLRVLTVDLDLEAPGLGSILLDDETLPQFGVIDALIENNFGGLDEKFKSELVGPSALADRKGKIDVIPAFGRASLGNPGDVLAKIARAYADDVSESGEIATMRDQIANLIAGFADPMRYDVVLIDARAGLNESTASPVLGLGAEVFFFGQNDRQTFNGYEALFAHLGRLISPDLGRPEWLDRITMVHGKAPLDSGPRTEFRDKCRDLFVRLGLSAIREDERKVRPGASPFRDVPWDESVSDEEVFANVDQGVLSTLTILEDERFRVFEPLLVRDRMHESVYSASYGDFVERIVEGIRALDTQAK